MAADAENPGGLPEKGILASIFGKQLEELKIGIENFKNNPISTLLEWLGLKKKKIKETQKELNKVKSSLSRENKYAENKDNPLYEEIRNIVSKLKSHPTIAELVDITDVRDSNDRPLVVTKNNEQEFTNWSVAPSLGGLALEYREKTGNPLMIVDGFRDEDEQRNVKSHDGVKAAPGYSHHCTGCGLDYRLEGMGEDEFRVLGAKYDFIFDSHTGHMTHLSRIENRDERKAESERMTALSRGTSFPEGRQPNTHLA